MELPERPKLPVMLALPPSVEVPETFRSVMLAVLVVKRLEDKSVAENILAPEKLILGFGWMIPIGPKTAGIGGGEEGAEFETACPEAMALVPAGPVVPGGPRSCAAIFGLLNNLCKAERRAESLTLSAGVLFPTDTRGEVETVVARLVR